MIDSPSLGYVQALPQLEIHRSLNDFFLHIQDEAILFPPPFAAEKLSTCTF